MCRDWTRNTVGKIIYGSERRSRNWMQNKVWRVEIKVNNSKTGPVGATLFLLANETGWHTWRENPENVFARNAGRADHSGV